MKIFLKIMFFIFLILGGTVLRGQNIKRCDFNENAKKKNSVNSVYTVKTNYPATGIVVIIDSSENFANSWISVREDTLFLSENEEREMTDGKKHSNLFTFDGYTDKFLFYPASLKNNIQFLYIDARPDLVKSVPANSQKKSAGCSEPVMIDQSVWRAGLTEPDYTRIENTVHNIIIHHTAGSNTATNYTDVVRNIYIYHTQGNGWSDIAYNYLIAQDGTIFKGRDPGTLEQDNVLGAHFCSSNTGTMGISVLGTYINVLPTDEAMKSLVDLLAWKTWKDKLNPQGINPHALNSNLNVIAGHRDGCDTECPGEMFYNKLGDIRAEVMNEYENCEQGGSATSENAIEEVSYRFYLSGETVLVNHKGYTISSVRIYDMSGRICTCRIDNKNADETEIQLKGVHSGVYLLNFLLDGRWCSEKVVMIK